MTSFIGKLVRLKQPLYNYIKEVHSSHTWFLGSGGHSTGQWVGVDPSLGTLLTRAHWHVHGVPGVSSSHHWQAVQWRVLIVCQSQAKCLLISILWFSMFITVLSSLTILSLNMTKVLKFYRLLLFQHIQSTFYYFASIISGTCTTNVKQTISAFSRAFLCHWHNTRMEGTIRGGWSLN